MTRISYAAVSVTLAAVFSLSIADRASAQSGSFVFGGAEASEGGYFGYVGGGFRPDGDINSSGWLVRGFAGAGSYEYDVGGPVDGQGDVVSVDLMAGYQTVSEDTRVSAYVGGNYQDHNVTNDPANPVEGAEWGVKGQVEVYSQPTPNSMVMGIASYSTAYDTYFGLARLGWKVGGGRAYFGPEIGVNGNERYDQWRAGLHVSGFDVGPVGVGVSAGYVDSDGESGAYGGLGFTVRY